MVAWLRDAADVDFETLPIRDRPLRPPRAVGVAIRVPGARTRYLSWGHVTGRNTCGWEEVRRTLGELYASGRPLLFHNAKFDVEVGEGEFDLPRLTWERYHDTLPALFIADPDAPDYALKSAAARLLNQPPDERDAVVDWLLEHQPVPGVTLSRSPDSDSYAGAYLAYAPVELVGPYACGDLTRMRDLANLVMPELETRDLVGAYDVERELMPHVIDMERQGIRVDRERLERDIAAYETEQQRVDAWLRRRLRATAELNLDSGPQLAAALVRAGFCTEAALGTTRTGKVQTNKDALIAAVQDKQILNVLRYRAQLKTCVGTFMRPWAETARHSAGLVFTDWNSTRTSREDGGAGTRTGRLSSSRIQNIPKRFAPLFREWVSAADEMRPEDLAKLPRLPYPVKPLPLVRSYIIPYEDDDCLLDRDYSQQELRALAHFCGGSMLDAYRADPWLDFHDMATKLINETLRANYKRKHIKNTGFGLIYGMGAGKLAAKNETDVPTARTLKSAYLRMFPGVKGLYDEARLRAKENRPIRTWGGREYFCEPPRFDPETGRWMTYDYKIPNRLIQGSSADITKRAMLTYLKAKPSHHRLILTVHDQLTASAPRRERDTAMEILRSAMEESITMDVPMLSEGSWSETNFQDLQDYDTKGKRVAR